MQQITVTDLVCYNCNMTDLSEQMSTKDNLVKNCQGWDAACESVN